MKEMSAFDKDVPLEMLHEQAKNVENLDGKRFVKEHSPGGARVNAVIDGQQVKKKV